MKKINIFSISSLLLTLVFLASCSDSFLEDKRNYDNVNTGIYDYYSGCEGRLNDLYSWCLPNTNSSLTWRNPSVGDADDAGKSTEEYSGFSAFVNPENPLTSMSGTIVPDYFQNQLNNIQESVWGRIRNINDFMKGVNGGSLSQDEKDEFIGQALFFRAWCYYNLVKWYGGVPIVTEVLEPVEGNYTPRSSVKSCIEFIVDDLNEAAKRLEKATCNGGWPSNKWGHVTSGTALALKGRVLLWWCSPIFNRSNDVNRWKEAYEEMAKDLITIQACGYGLYQTANNINGSDFAAMFCQPGKNPEAVFVTLYNNITTSGLTQKNNPWERGVRPGNTTGSGKNPSAMLVDMFPMKDGKCPGTLLDNYTKLEKSSIEYKAEYPFVGRDPRFYRTFAFPGVRWAYNGDASEKDPYNPNDGANYALWNYVWYTEESALDDPESSECYGADNLLKNAKGMYVRKRSDDLDVNSPLYSWDILQSGGGFACSAAPYIELRYAEVLLNLAEVACGAGQTEVAIQFLRQIRQRVGYTGDCGIPDGMKQDVCMSAVLYERQIELAYEGKRFDDMRRWMLFDGGAEKVEGAPESWTLTGWDGNTCTWLGFKSFNGQRRENIEFRTAGEGDDYAIGGTTYDSDPLVVSGENRCAPIDLRKELDEDGQTANLQSWYENYLKRKTKKGDSYDQNHIPLYIKFLPRYYFLGLSKGAQSNNKQIGQTIGWEDNNNGGAMGTFDPFVGENENN
ncbi:MAG: RagB/SusD family nutrient uptake outer membrane protein [Prevotella sp.]|nr:RagB/SusD family nutrient uptake outer membrane protein [Candidatus Equicola stercoris]